MNTVQYIVLSLCLIGTANGAIRVLEADASIPADTDLAGSAVINFRPGTNKVVTSCNPPRMSWAYSVPSSNTFADNVAKQFRFQLATNIQFTNLIADVLTPWNFWSRMAPLNTNMTQYWRIIYLDVAGVTTNAIRTNAFTIAPGTVEWDRSLLANTNYLATNGAHPHIYFNARNRGDVLAFMQTNPIVSNVWVGVLQSANNTVSSNWWPSTMPPTTVVTRFDWADRILNVALAYGLTLSNSYTNVAAAISVLATNYTNVSAFRDSISSSEDKIMMPALAWGYDWTYGAMNATERSIVLNALEQRCRFIMCTDDYWWWRSTNFFGDLSMAYSGTRLVQYYGAAKFATSHGYENTMYAQQAALAGYADSTNCFELFDNIMEYLINIGSPYGFEGGVNQGLGYGGGISFTDSGELHHYQQFATTFREVAWEQNPYWKNSMEWWDNMVPVGFAHANEPWGDTASFGFTNWRLKIFGRTVGYFMSNISATNHWFRQQQITGGTDNDSYGTALPLYWWPGTATNTIAYTNASIIDGWGFIHSGTNSEYAGFTNGIGLIFPAKPRGSEMQHSDPIDLSLQLYAYGSVLTDGGAGMNQYSKHPISQNAVLVNGRGMFQSLAVVLSDYYARHIAFTNVPGSFTYMAADGKDAYPTKNFIPGGWLTPYGVSLYYGGAPLSFLSKARRHVAMIRDRYWVILDDYSVTGTNASFTSMYHIYFDSLSNLVTNSANGISFDYWVNARKLNGFSSTAPNVDVKVLFNHKPTELTVRHLTGTNVPTNPLLGEDYNFVGLGNYIRTNSIWMTKTNATNWYFMSVVYPVKPGTAAPTLERVDDFTVRVTHFDASAETVSFNSNDVSSDYVFAVANGSSDTNPPAPPSTNTSPLFNGFRGISLRPQ